MVLAGRHTLTLGYPVSLRNEVNSQDLRVNRYFLLRKESEERVNPVWDSPGLTLDILDAQFFAVRAALCLVGHLAVPTVSVIHNSCSTHPLM